MPGRIGTRRPSGQPEGHGQGIALAKTHAKDVESCGHAPLCERVIAPRRCILQPRYRCRVAVPLTKTRDSSYPEVDGLKASRTSQRYNSDIPLEPKATTADAFHPLRTDSRGGKVEAAYKADLDGARGTAEIIRGLSGRTEEHHQGSGLERRMLGYCQRQVL